MAKKGDAGCAPLIVVGVILFALGKCVGGPEPEASSPQGLYSAPTEAAPAVTALYVQTRSLNCRASPSRKSTIITKYVRGQEIGITDYSGDWALVPQGGVDGCWVARQNLSESPPPENSAAVTAAPVLSRRSAIETLNDGPSCGTKWKCGQMDSCEEAYHYLNQCGLGRLDGDGDGVPCESIC
ncbi:MAG: excalibur calcium-binding domain-containing protein [Proteobacteria bacterium]|jgi:hypothetical protein|nr:excalibur calcium-binding domain-containing protein [Pseudomonadota bacterium]